MYMCGREGERERERERRNNCFESTLHLCVIRLPYVSKVSKTDCERKKRERVRHETCDSEHCTLEKCSIFCVSFPYKLKLRTGSSFTSPADPELESGPMLLSLEREREREQLQRQFTFNLVVSIVI